MEITVSQKDIKPFLSKDMFKPPMQHVYYDATEQKLVATTGEILIAVPVESNLEKSVLLPVSILPKGASNRTIVEQEGERYTVTEYDKKGGVTETRIVAAVNETFPPWKEVLLPEDQVKPLEKIDLDVGLLSAFAPIVQKLTGSKQCKFDFFGSLHMVLVRPAHKDNADAFLGIIMPCRIPEN